MNQIFTAMIAVYFINAMGKSTDKKSSKIVESSELHITSKSINDQGKLLTVTASPKSPNDPPGENLSPQVSWSQAVHAPLFVVCMFDMDANILHWLVQISGLNENTLKQGAYTDTSVYIGPRPPVNDGRHHYRIEVFALMQSPDQMNFAVATKVNYTDVIKSLDTAGDVPGNIIVRSHVIGTYQHGDNTVR